MLRFLKSLFQLILSPERGWEDISAEGTEPRVLLETGLYPLLGVTAASFFLNAVYHSGMQPVYLVQQAIILFIQYFLTFFVAQFVFTSYIHRYISSEVSRKRNDTYIAYGIALLALVSLLHNCIPVNLAIINFLPIYVAVVLWRGVRYMAVLPEKVGKFILLAIGSIIIPPYVIGFLFDIILPGS